MTSQLYLIDQGMFYTKLISLASQTLYLTSTRKNGLGSVVGRTRFCGIHLRFAVISENIIKIDVNRARVNHSFNYSCTTITPGLFLLSKGFG